MKEEEGGRIRGRERQSAAARKVAPRRVQAATTQAAPAQAAPAKVTPVQVPSAALTEAKATIRRLKAELAAAEAQIAELQASAETDFLLDILNRRGFERELNRSLPISSATTPAARWSCSTSIA